MPRGYKTPPEASSAAPMIYSYLWPNAGFCRAIWVESYRGFKEVIVTWSATGHWGKLNSEYYLTSWNKKCISENYLEKNPKRIGSQEAVCLCQCGFGDHKLPDAFTRGEREAVNLAWGHCFLWMGPSSISRETLSTSGSSQQCRHWKAHHGVARGGQQMLPINSAHRPQWKSVLLFFFCFHMDKTIWTLFKMLHLASFIWKNSLG